MSNEFSRYQWILSLILATVVAGCGRNKDPYARYIPDEDKATAAVQAALEAWKHGAPAGPVADTAKPQVVVVDSWREKKQKLESYQILGEVPGNTPRCYAVRLNLTDPDAEERARFVVVGIDPLWVFRYEDFQLIAHWDHRMPEEEPAKNEEKSASDEEPTINNEQQSENDSPEKTAGTEAAQSEPIPE